MREWAQQMEMREDVYDGEPVFADYSDDFHCPEKYRSTGLPDMDYLALVCGIDCGQTLSPAALLYGITKLPYQVHALLEVTSEGGESMETFAPRLLRATQQRLPRQWADVRYVGDATVTQRSGSRGETAQQVAKPILGSAIKPMSNVWPVRYAAMTWLLTDRIDGKARFVIDGARCRVFRKAMQGAYQFEISPRGDTVGPGRVLQMPLKNEFSHIADGGQYGAQEIRKFVEGTGGKVHRRSA